MILADNIKKRTPEKQISRDSNWPISVCLCVSEYTSIPQKYNIVYIFVSCDRLISLYRDDPARMIIANVLFYPNHVLQIIL